MKFLYFLAILMSSFNLILAQDQSGSGTISNYQIFCSGSTDQCVNTDNVTDTIVIMPQVNGQVKVTVTLTGGSVTCCDGQIFPQAIGASLISNANQNLFTFLPNTTSQTTRFCVGPEDVFRLVISGSKGEYNYQVETTSSLYAPESNDVANGEYLNANTLQPNMIGLGTIGHGYDLTDLNDWYKIGADKEGKLKLAIETDGRANFFLKRLNQTDLDFVYFFAPGTDTLMVDCVAPGDTFAIYIVPQSNQCASYSLKYWVEEDGVGSDKEYNDEADSAFYAEPDLMHEGHIGYGIYAADLDDYFLLVADDDGEFKLNLQGSAFRYTLFEKRLVGVYAQGVVLEGQDSVSIECVGQLDTLYLLIERYNFKCSEYSFDYLVNEPSGTSDMESNDELQNAVYALPDMNHEGRIGFGQYAPDLYDYYLLVADDDGDLKVKLQGTRFRYALIENLTKTALNLDTVLAEQDSVNIECVGKKDSFYLLIEPVDYFCSEYSFEYSVDSPMTGNDSESEEESQGFQILTALQTVEGRVGYGFYLFEDADRFKIAADANGCLQVIVRVLTRELYFICEVRIIW